MKMRVVEGRALSIRPAPNNYGYLGVLRSGDEIEVLEEVRQLLSNFSYAKFMYNGEIAYAAVKRFVTPKQYLEYVAEPTENQVVTLCGNYYNGFCEVLEIGAYESISLNMSDGKSLVYPVKQPEEPQPPDEPPTEPYTDLITIPAAPEGWAFYQFKHESPPRQDNFSESVDRHLPMPATVPMTKKELWHTVPADFVQLQRDLARLDSPNRTAEQHETAFLSLTEPHRAFTDLGNWHGVEDYAWKVSLSTSGNIVLGWKNGTNLHIKCINMLKPAPKAEEIYNQFWLCHRATQIHPRVEYLFDTDGNRIPGEINNKLPDGTYPVTHFPQGENCTTFPLMYPGDEIIVSDMNDKLVKLSEGDKVKVVNLRSDQ